MAKNMLVLLDMQNQILHLYTENGIEDYRFDQLRDIRDAIGGDSVIYVTGAAVANAEQILHCVAGADEAAAITQEGGDPNRMYLRSTKKGPLFIPGVNLSFKHEADCKLISLLPPNLFQVSDEVKALLHNGILEIISEPKKKRIKKQYDKNIVDKKVAKNKKAKLARQLSAAEMAEHVFDDDGDNETIDMTDEIKRGR